MSNKEKGIREYRKNMKWEEKEIRRGKKRSYLNKLLASMHLDLIVEQSRQSILKIEMHKDNYG